MTEVKHNPLRVAIFKNTKKKGGASPDYYLVGDDINISLWVGDKNKGGDNAPVMTGLINAEKAAGRATRTKPAAKSNFDF